MTHTEINAEIEKVTSALEQEHIKNGMSSRWFILNNLIHTLNNKAVECIGR